MPPAIPGYGVVLTTEALNPRARSTSAARSLLTPMRSGITYLTPRSARLTSSATLAAADFGGGCWATTASGG